MKFRSAFSQPLGYVFSSIVLLAGTVNAVTVTFDEEDFTVTPGDEITLVTTLDAPIEHGLDSYHLRLNFPEGLFELTEGDIAVPAELDYDLFDPGAIRSVTATSAEVRGFAELGSPYEGTAFVSFTVEIGVNAPAGEQDLTLEIPQENGFVDGEQNVLDDQITFGTATVSVVVPPPEVAGIPEMDPDSGDVSLAFTGLPGRTYRLEISDDLETWTPLVEVTADSEGNIAYQDTQASAFDRRFYRLVDR